MFLQVNRMVNLSSRVYLLVWRVDDFYLGRNELWAIFASGTSLTIACSVHIKRFVRQGSGRTADLPAKLNSSQLRRLAGSKGLRWLLLPTAYVFICRNSTPGSTCGCVAGSSAAYENQALRISLFQVPNCFYSV